MSSETVLASFTRSLINAGESMGIPRPEFLAVCKVREQDLEDPDGRVTFAQHVAAWEPIATRFGELPFGLRMGQMARWGQTGVIGLAARQQPSVRGVIGCFKRYRSVVNALMMPEFEVEDGRLLVGGVMPPPWSALHYISDFRASSTSHFFQEMTKGRFVPLTVRFQHAAPTDFEPYRETFPRSELVFSAEFSRVEFDESVLEVRPGWDVDPILGSYLEHHCKQLQERLPRDEDLTGQVRKVLLDELRGGDPSQEKVARRLGLSPRTLQRRLKERGGEFSSLLDDLRRELAQSYMRERHLALGEVAWLLGYNDPSAFFRACKRWSGKTPAELRAGILAA